jgi:hypothetical protein
VSTPERTVSDASRATNRVLVHPTLWFLLVFLGLGFTTWAAFLYVAVRARRRSWLAWSAVYGALLVLSVVTTSLAGTNSAASGISIVAGMIAWLGGTVHAAIIRRDAVRQIRSSPDPEREPRWVRPGLSEIWRWALAFCLLASTLLIVAGSAYRIGLQIFYDYAQEYLATGAAWPHSHSVNIGYFPAGINERTFTVPFPPVDNSSAWSGARGKPAVKVPGYTHVGLTFSDISPSSSTLDAQLIVWLDPSLVRHLKFDHAGQFSPLTLSDSSQWEGLPVTLLLLPCATDLSISDYSACVATSTVHINLGDLLRPDGTSLPPLPTSQSVDLYAFSDPSAYPQDTYAAYLYPVIILPSGIEFAPDGQKPTATLPVSLTLLGGPSLVGKDVFVRTGRTAGFEVVVSRQGIDQILAYAMSLIPFFLGLIIFCITLGKRSTESWIPIVIGYLTVWLTILPLRLVLVPQELGATPLTRIDEILIFDAAGISFFVALTFVKIILPIGRAKSRDQAKRLNDRIKRLEAADLSDWNEIIRDELIRRRGELARSLDQLASSKEHIPDEIKAELDTLDALIAELPVNVTELPVFSESFQMKEDRVLARLRQLRRWFYGDKIVGEFLDELRSSFGREDNKAQESIAGDDPPP